MKIWERVMDTRIRRETKNQFGFMAEKLTTEPLLCVNKLEEKYRKKMKNLCIIFID